MLLLQDGGTTLCVVVQVLWVQFPGQERMGFQANRERIAIVIFARRQNELFAGLGGFQVMQTCVHRFGRGRRPPERGVHHVVPHMVNCMGAMMAIRIVSTIFAGRSRRSRGRIRSTIGAVHGSIWRISYRPYHNLVFFFFRYEKLEGKDF